MRRLLKRTVQTAVEMDLVESLQAVDGTKVGANVAKSRTYDADGLRRLMGRLDEVIADLEAQNEAGPSAGHLPEELHDRKVLRDQVRKTISCLGGRDGQKFINLTDQDARMMDTRQGIAMAYNAQAMVSPVTADGKTAGMLITAADETTDQSQLRRQAEETSRAETTLADAGYHSGSNLECARRGQQVVCRSRRSGRWRARFTRTASSTTRRATATVARTLRFSGVRRGRRNIVSTAPPVRVPGLSGLRGLYDEQA